MFLCFGAIEGFSKVLCKNLEVLKKYFIVTLWVACVIYPLIRQGSFIFSYESSSDRNFGFHCSVSPLFWIYVILCAIWYHLYNFKKREKTHGGVLLLVKVILFHECFSRLLNCTNGTRSRKSSHIFSHKQLAMPFCST